MTLSTTSRAPGRSWIRPTLWPAIGNAARRHDGHRHRVDDLREQGDDTHARRLGRRGLAVQRAVTAGLAALSDDHVRTVRRRGAGVLHGRDHGHDLDAAPMALLDELALE